MKQRERAEATFILMETAGITRTTPQKVAVATCMKIRARMLTRTRPSKVEIEVICTDGDSCRMDMHGHGCSTSAGIMMVIGKLKTKEQRKRAQETLWFFRVYHDGLLVREWDEIKQRYNLEID